MHSKHNYGLSAVGLSQQKALDVDQRAIQQIVFQGVVEEVDNKKTVYYF